MRRISWVRGEGYKEEYHRLPTLCLLNIPRAMFLGSRRPVEGSQKHRQGHHVHALHYHQHDIMWDPAAIYFARVAETPTVGAGARGIGMRT